MQTSSSPRGFRTVLMPRCAQHSQYTRRDSQARRGGHAAARGITAAADAGFPPPCIVEPPLDTVRTRNPGTGADQPDLNVVRVIDTIAS